MSTAVALASTVKTATPSKRCTTGGIYTVAALEPHVIAARHDYVYNFSATKLPLDRSYDGESIDGVVIYKFGTDEWVMKKKCFKRRFDLFLFFCF